MMMNDSLLPRIRIELEGIRQYTEHAFLQNNEELSKMVIDEIERQLQLNWVQDKIRLSVELCIKEAIDDVSNNYKLKSAITELIGDSIEKLIKEPK